MEPDVLNDFLKSTEYANRPLRTLGEVKRLLKDLALRQVNVLAAREVYSALDYPGVGARSNDLDSGPISDIAERLFGRIRDAQTRFSDIDLMTWRQEFVKSVEARAATLRAEWEANWVRLCSGKLLFIDLQKKVEIKMSLRKFKKMVAQEMRLRRNADYLAMERILQSILA
ncbi:MAG: hypothetical protein M3M96_05035 [Candidatus Eremiobacteraeota bacterium]|nr:hypothetical protein [Candidatus Eremiobacteraeota bacterium]